jgi:hypothetical protein
MTIFDFFLVDVRLAFNCNGFCDVKSLAICNSFFARLETTSSFAYRQCFFVSFKQTRLPFFRDVAFVSSSQLTT